MAIEEVEDEFGADAPQAGEVYLRYARVLFELAKLWETVPGNDAQDEGQPDPVCEAWRYARRAVAALGKAVKEKMGEPAAEVRLADAQVLAGEIAESAAGGGRLKEEEGLAREEGKKHAAEGERMRRAMLVRGRGGEEGPPPALQGDVGL